MSLQEILQSLETLSENEQEILLDILRQRQNDQEKTSIIGSLRGKYAKVTESSDQFSQRKHRRNRKGKSQVVNIILDACAVIAFFRDEVGADIVEDYLCDRNACCIIHSLNLCEVYYDF